MEITYGFYPAPFAEMIIGKTARGICWVGFMVEGYKGNGQARMHKHFPNAHYIHDDNAIEKEGAEIIKSWSSNQKPNIELDLHGTAFQKSVWNALLDIKKGETKSYSDLAAMIGKDRAIRAVGSAVGENPISLTVPCHRILQKSGGIGNYGWGRALKQRLLKEEGVCAAA